MVVSKFSDFGKKEKEKKKEWLAHPRLLMGGMEEFGGMKSDYRGRAKQAIFLLAGELCNYLEQALWPEHIEPTETGRLNT